MHLGGQLQLYDVVKHVTNIACTTLKTFNNSYFTDCLGENQEVDALESGRNGVRTLAQSRPTRTNLAFLNTR